MSEGHAVVSHEVLARYAADAAREVAGVHGLADGGRPGHRPVRITEGERGVTVELDLSLDWGASAPDVGEQVQARVAEYLGRMTDVRLASVDVVVAEVTPPPASS